MMLFADDVWARTALLRLQLLARTQAWLANMAQSQANEWENRAFASALIPLLFVLGASGFEMYLLQTEASLSVPAYRLWAASLSASAEMTR
jgi:hypothetical protein